MIIAILICGLIMPTDSLVLKQDRPDPCNISCLSHDLASVDSSCVCNFLKCFSNIECTRNVEWSEGANEILFKIINKQPRVFFSVLFSLSRSELAAIKHEIDHPVNEGIPVVQIVQNLKRADMSEPQRKRALQFLKYAYDQQLDFIRVWEKTNNKKWVFPPWD